MELDTHGQVRYHGLILNRGFGTWKFTLFAFSIVEHFIFMFNTKLENKKFGGWKQD